MNYLDKFDKEFDEKFPDDLYEVRSFGTEDYKYRTDEIREFAHSHLEAAYRAGKNEAISEKIEASEVIKAYIYEELKNAFKEGQQSNLERLIEKCGDRFTSLQRIRVADLDGAVRWTMKMTDGSLHPTPTEAVENLIKTLNL